MPLRSTARPQIRAAQRLTSGTRRKKWARRCSGWLAGGAEVLLGVEGGEVIGLEGAWFGAGVVEGVGHAEGALAEQARGEVEVWGRGCYQVEG